MNGKNNEFNFVLAINRKKITEINVLLQELIRVLFPEITPSSEIKAWKNHYKQKTDVLIKVGNTIKKISIKMGSRNSVHVEHVSTFIEFMRLNNIPEEVINNYLYYHYGDDTLDGSGVKRLDSSLLKDKYKREIDEINLYFNNKKLIIKAIDRFVLKGLVFHDYVDAIVVGTPDDFLFIKRDEVYKIILDKKDKYCSAPHFGPLVCQSFGRCLNYNKRYEWNRNFVQVKWYSLFDDIVEHMNKQSLKSDNVGP